MSTLLPLFLPSILLIIGLVLLTYSANFFIEGSMSLASHFNISTLTIGIVVLGFGTSAPEMIISALSSFQGFSGLAVGNVIGSNIANVGLVLGIAALIYPVPIMKSTLKFETALMISVSTIVTLMLLWDQQLDFTDGILLIALFIVVIGLFYYQATQPQDEKNKPINEASNTPKTSLQKSLITTLLALIVLLLSARASVWGASEIASYFGISDTLIGLTVVAIGTSLPELATAISASIKKQPNLTIGNILGSNLFNLLIVLPFPAFITGFQMPERFVFLDLPIMLMLALAIPIVAISSKNGSINRLSGVLFFAIYVGYMILLFR